MAGSATRPTRRTPFTGIDTFDYTIIDDAGDFDFATASIEIDPQMHNDNYSTPFQTPLTVSAPGVTANDLGAGFVDSYDHTSAHGGTVTMDDDGGFTYTPAAGFSGTDSFLYTVNDIGLDNLFSAIAHVQVGAGGGTTTTTGSSTTTLPGATTTTTVPTTPPPPPKPQGYWMVGKTGAVYAFGAVKNYGGSPTAGVSHLEPTPTRRGYWIVNTAGHVFADGDAKSYGSASGLLARRARHEPLVESFGPRLLVVHRSRERVIVRGDAKFYGDAHAKHLNGPIVGSVATSDGKGYYLVGSDGGIFTYGDAVFHGSMGNRRLNKPVNGLVPTKDGRGYWLVASDGGIFAFHAPYRGSMGGKHLNRPIIGMVRYGNGYLMVGSDGGIFNFSNQPFLGSLGGKPPAAPIVGVATGG